MTLTFGQIFKMTFEGQIIVHSTRLKKRNAMFAIYWPAFTESKVITRLFSQEGLFLEFLLSGGQTVELRSNLRTPWQKSVKRAIEFSSLQRCSSSGSPDIC